jgi:hypothetical protein
VRVSFFVLRHIFLEFSVMKSKNFAHIRFFVILKFELGFVLSMQALYSLSHTFRFFCSGDRALLFAWPGLDHDPYVLYFLPSLGSQICITIHNAWLRCGHMNFLPGLVLICNLPEVSLPSS